MPRNLLTPHAVLPALPLLAGAAALFFWLTLASWPLTVDDAFITFRYAQNLASGQGPTFNPGEPPVEGTTSFAWLLLMTIPHLLHLDAVVFAKIVGVLATTALLFATFQAARRATPFLLGSWRLLPPAAAVMLLCLMPVTAVHTVTGMETAFFTLCLTAFLDAVGTLSEKPRAAAALRCGLLALLTGLSRPEGNLAVAVALVAAATLAPQLRRGRIPWALAATYLLPGALYMVWRWQYYGLPFPLPFYVKVTSSRLGGTEEVLHFVRVHGLAIGPLVALGLLAMRRRQLPMLLGAGTMIVFFLFPAHIMGYDQRYLFPVQPSLAVFTAMGFALLHRRIGQEQNSGRSPTASQGRRGASSRWLVGAALGAIYALGLVWAGSRYLSDIESQIASRRNYAWSLQHTAITLGKQLRAAMTDGGTPCLAVADAGAIPYYSTWRCVDLFGLNDATIARFGHDPDYVMAQQPDMVILSTKSAVQFEPRFAWMGPLYARCLAAGWSRVDVAWFREGQYYFWILADSTAPVVRRYLDLRAARALSAKVVFIAVKCETCGNSMHLQANLGEPTPLKQGRVGFPAGDLLRCPTCGSNISLTQTRLEIESQSGQRIVP